MLHWAFYPDKDFYSNKALVWLLALDRRYKSHGAVTGIAVGEMVKTMRFNTQPLAAKYMCAPLREDKGIVPMDYVLGKKRIDIFIERLDEDILALTPNAS